MTITATGTDEAALRLLAGRGRAVERMPYLATALFAMKPIRCTDPRMSTFAVDKNWRVYWNAEFVLTLTVDEVAACWLHEVGHLLRAHNERFTALAEPQERHPLWNKGADASINEALREANVTLPPIKAFFPEHVPGGTKGMTAEQFYRLLLDTPEADRVTAQKEPLVLMPGAAVEGKVAGRMVVAISRTRGLDETTTLTLTDVDGNQARTENVKVHDRRTLSFSIADELPAGAYLVTLTTGTQELPATFTVVTPQIRLRPDHLARGWVAPQRMTVVGSLTEFTENASVTLTDENGVPYRVSDTTRVSNTYLTFDVEEQIPDGLYTLTVIDGPVCLRTSLPVGMPFLDLLPDALPVGHGTPYPFAIVADDLVLDATTTLDVLDPLTGSPLGLNVSALSIKTPTSADFTLNESLDEGQYLVRVTTGSEYAVAVLSVSAATDSGPSEESGQGSGDGEENDGDDDGDGDGDGESQGGKGQGQGEGQGDRDPNSPWNDDCGSGAGGTERPWDHSDDNSDGSVNSGRGHLIREQVAREIVEHTKGRGTVPGAWSRWANNVLKPQVDWRKELRSVVSRTCAAVAGLRDYSYSRPSRRASAMTNVIMPAMRAPRPPRVGVVVDTSGSVSDKMLAQAMGDITALLKRVNATGGAGLSVIACDAAAGELQTVRRADSITLAGGGGTDMRVGILEAAKARPPMDLIITMTDGYTPYPDEPPVENPRARYVVVLLNGDAALSSVPDWMHAIPVDDAYLANQNI